MKDLFVRGGGRPWVGWLVAVAAIDALACGPFFPNRLLTDSDRELVEVPVGIFSDEVARILPPASTSVVARAAGTADSGSEIDRTAAADLADLGAALAQSPWPAFAQRRIAGRYREVREALSARAQAVARWSGVWDLPSSAAAIDRVRPLDSPALPVGLPWEFREYTRGAIRLHQGDVAGARLLWSRLLAAKPERRQYRSTWAAYMLARTTPDTAAEEAVAAYGRVRELADAGFADSLGLSAASLGWEARVELRRDNLKRAIHLYAQQIAADDSVGLVSLAQAAGRALARDAAAQADLVRDPLCRGVMAALIVSSEPDPWEPGERGAERAARFLQAVESAGVTDLSAAAALGWVAYRAGRFDEARRWLDRAQPCEGQVRWLRAKLLLREGRVDVAAAELHALLATVAPEVRLRGGPRVYSPYDDMPLDLRADPPGRRIRGELGVLLLGRQRFTDALDLLLRGGYWDDAAYVAERVMPTADVRAVVDAAWPESRAGSGLERARASEDAARSRPDAVRLRHLLGRRMVRENAGADARRYFPVELRARLDAYLEARARGEDAARPAHERAAALMAAARLARYDGLELMGTELEPDWCLHAGQLEQPGITVARGAPGGARLAPASAAELRAVADTTPAPNVRFHYRYVALDLAWAAAERMPDQDPATAAVLCEAGRWVMDRDPKSADRFYKALVRRCGRTPLGALADRLHWFPTPEQLVEAGRAAL